LVLDRGTSLAHEVVKFGVVGGIGFIIDVGTFNGLRYVGEPGFLHDSPISAKLASVAVATVFTYLGNRHWTWRHRQGSQHRREAVLFVALNGIGMLIAVACLALSHYVLDLQSALDDNISANVVGLLLGMVFRFWSYRTFVFRAPESPGPASMPVRKDALTGAP
jgi:putative flippase GtrA